MAPPFKRTKTTATSKATSEGADPVGSVSTPPQLFIPFQTEPSLDCIPDDVLHEILSHLPALSNYHVLFGRILNPPVIPSTELVRIPTLRVLSQTSRLLRSRCLEMAWRSIEFCTANIPKHHWTYYAVLGEATKTGIRVLNTCPHLVPLVRTVTFALTRYNSREIIAALADCFTTLPNLTTIQVIRTPDDMATAIKDMFQGKRFPSVRRISLPCTAHGIIRSCPNLEEVTLTEGDDRRIIKSLIEGNCRKVCILRGACVNAPLTPLVKLIPNLKYVSVSTHFDMALLASFPFLETIQISVCRIPPPEVSLGEFAASQINEASKVLRENKSQAVKTVIVKRQNSTWEHCHCKVVVDEVYLTETVTSV